MDNTATMLSKLLELKDFKMYKTDEYYFVIEAEGEKYLNNGAYNIEESMFNAYVHILTRILAKEFVKNAKVVLE